MALTDTACRAAKGRETEYKLPDGGGLYLLVKPSGLRLWNQAYRFSGKQKKLPHGGYPSVSLAEARRLRDEAKKLLASEVDSGANKKSVKLTAVVSATNTFGGIAEGICNASRMRALPRPPSRKTAGCLSVLPAPILALDQLRISARQKFSRCCNGSNAAGAGRRHGGCVA